MAASSVLLADHLLANVYEEHWPLIQSSEPFKYINNDTYLSFVLKIALELPHSLCRLACEGFESGKVWKLY